MTAQTKRTLYRLLALFLAAGGGDAIVQFATGTTYDYRHLAGALVVAAVLAGEKYLSEGNPSMASPTVDAVNEALRPAPPINEVAGLTATPATFAGTSLPVRYVRPPSEPTPR